jgi:integrase
LGGRRSDRDRGTVGAAARGRRRGGARCATYTRLGAEWHDEDLICDRGDGGALHPDSFSTAFKRLAVKVGLPKRTHLHEVRHAFATMMLAQGVHPAIASSVLGHASPAFTMSVYQHVLDGMSDQAATAIERAFGT